MLRVNDWAPGEAETARTIDRILATQFVDDAEVRRQVAADAPRARQQAERLRAYVPRTPALQQIHRDYVTAWEGLVTGYASIENGLNSGNAAQLAAGRQALEAWRAGVVSVASRLRDLIESSGATVQRPNQRLGR